MRLEHATVWRGGVTRPRKKNQNTSVYISSVSKPHHRNGLRIEFVMGEEERFTSIEIDIAPEDFATLAQLMIEGAPDDALNAFGQAIVNRNRIEEEEKKREEEWQAEMRAKYGDDWD